MRNSLRKYIQNLMYKRIKCKCKGLTPGMIITECINPIINSDFIIKDLKEKLKNYKRMFN